MRSPAIIIDQNEKNVGARNFTLFHELCHLLVRQAGISNFSPRNAVEAFCNKFAASFLMPKKAVEAAFSHDALHIREPNISELENSCPRIVCHYISAISSARGSRISTKAGYFSRISRTIGGPLKKKRGRARSSLISTHTCLDMGNHLPNAVFASMDRGTISSLDGARILELSPANFDNVRKVLKDRHVQGEMSELI